jgi:hypothetical protein
MSIAQQALARAADGDGEGAVALLSAHSSDPEARLVLGLWRIEGQLLPRDLAAARDELAAVADLGHAGAGRTLAGMVASGAGGDADLPRAVAMLDHWQARDTRIADQYALVRQIAAATGTDVRRGETLQILRYAPGQEYRPHLDAIPGLANQRVLTVLVYLNNDYAGGEIDFPEIGLAVRGRTGDALMFANALPDGRPDPVTRHAGRPVTQGIKLLASWWIRARPAEDGAFGRDEATG